MNVLQEHHRHLPDAGVESQRTFNRVFRERYKVTSREYRNLYHEQYISQTQDEISGMEK